MRIAQFTESYRPVINGAAVAVDLLVQELARRHHVEVFAPGYPGHADGGAHRVHRFPSYRWPAQKDYPLAVPWSPALKARFRSAGMEIVHTHSPFALGQVGRRWARGHRLALVTTYHTLYEEYSHYAPFLPRAPIRRALRDLSLRYCNSCDAVVVPTDPIRQVLLGYGVRRPIEVIPTGLRLGPPRPEDPAFPRGALGIPAGAPLALYAGRLAREKNLELLFGGFACAAREVPDARLLIAGSGPLEAEARRLARETGAGDRVHFAGFLLPERMPEVYAAADVFAFSSLTDTQGLVLTEAKAAGVPVVSVDAFGPGVLVRHEVDGLLTRNDAAEFGGAVARLLKDPELRRRMRLEAVEGARRFSIEATAEAYERLYERALGIGC